MHVHIGFIVTGRAGNYLGITCRAHGGDWAGGDGAGGNVGICRISTGLP